jgi:hypothetical protein
MHASACTPHVHAECQHLNCCHSVAYAIFGPFPQLPVCLQNLVAFGTCKASAVRLSDTCVCRSRPHHTASTPICADRSREYSRTRHARVTRPRPCRPRLHAPHVVTESVPAWAQLRRGWLSVPPRRACTASGGSGSTPARTQCARYRS